MVRRSVKKKALPQPHKRPSQARSQFTVQVLYEAFVRIWRRDGSAATSMRAIAEEAGYSVGALYEYFPNREALLSGYYRHCLDALSETLLEQDRGSQLPWKERLRALVSLVFDEGGKAPYFDAEMLLCEPQIAGVAEQRRAFTRMCDSWEKLLQGWPDLAPPSREVVEALCLTLWGARRYGILLGGNPTGALAVGRAHRIAVAILEQDQDSSSQA